MKKKHENPEFQVIDMEQANAKFYAASPGYGGGGDEGLDSGADYDNGTGVDGTNDLY